VVTVDAHDSAITALAFSADGARIASGAADGMVRVWDWQARSMISEAQPAAGEPIVQLAFAPETDLLAIGTYAAARLWRYDTGSIRALPIGINGASEVLVFSPDGTRVVGGNKTAGLYVWNPADGALLSRLPGMVGESVAAGFSIDGGLLATAAFGVVPALWDMSAITENTVNRADLAVGTTLVFNTEWTPDGRLLLFYDAAGAVYAWGVG
jgi:WD40 repeat protein